MPAPHDRREAARRTVSCMPGRTSIRPSRLRAGRSAARRRTAAGSARKTRTDVMALFFFPLPCDPERRPVSSVARAGCIAKYCDQPAPGETHPPCVIRTGSWRHAPRWEGRPEALIRDGICTRSAAVTNPGPFIMLGRTRCIPYCLLASPHWLRPPHFPSACRRARAACRGAIRPASPSPATGAPSVCRQNNQGLQHGEARSGFSGSIVQPEKYGLPPSSNSVPDLARLVPIRTASDPPGKHGELSTSNGDST